MSNDLKSIIICEIQKGFAFSGKPAMSEGVVSAFAEEVIKSCDGITVDRVSGLFVEARKKWANPTTKEIAEAWSILRLPEIVYERVMNAPRILRGCARKIYSNQEMVFKDPIMRALCLQYRISDTLAPPSEFSLSNDKEIRRNYIDLWEKHKGRRDLPRVMIGLGNRRDSVAMIPTAEELIAIESKNKQLT